MATTTPPPPNQDPRNNEQEVMNSPTGAVPAPNHAEDLFRRANERVEQETREGIREIRNSALRGGISGASSALVKHLMDNILDWLNF